MTGKKTADMPTNPPNPNDTINKESFTSKSIVDQTVLHETNDLLLKEMKTKANPTSESPKTGKAIVPSKGRAKKVPKLIDMTVDNLEILISKVVAAELSKWSSQSTIIVETASKDLNNSASRRPYLNSEGKYILLKKRQRKSPDKLNLSEICLLNGRGNMM